MRARPSFETVCKNANSQHKSSTFLCDKFAITTLNKYTDSHQISRGRVSIILKCYIEITIILIQQNLYHFEMLH